MGRQTGHESGFLVHKARPKLKKPSLYQVLILNDDFTPMDFVVVVCKLFFGMTTDQAIDLMLKVHYEGRAVCGVFTKDVAETKALQINDYARQYEHPLLCIIERL